MTGFQSGPCVAVAKLPDFVVRLYMSVNETRGCLCCAGWFRELRRLEQHQQKEVQLVLSEQGLPLLQTVNLRRARTAARHSA